MHYLKYFLCCFYSLLLLCGFSVKFGAFHVITGLLFIICHNKSRYYDFFNAVSLRAAIFKTRSFFEIYIHHEVFNRGTNLVSV